MLKLFNNIKLAVKFVAILWIIELLDQFLKLDLNRFGIIPRTITGLRGIIFAPFLHSDLYHLISNTIPLLILLFLLYTVYKKISFNLIVLSIIINGILVWIFARGNIHIGASGLIYSLASFLITIGFLRKKVGPIIISIVVIILYGGLIWGVLPTRAGISWEGHLFGALTGIFLAIAYKNKYIEENTY